jgi:hypothetical protein
MNENGQEGFCFPQNDGEVHSNQYINAGMRTIFYWIMAIMPQVRSICIFPEIKLSSCRLAYLLFWD